VCIVREADLAWTSAATRAVSAELTRPRPSGRRGPEYLAPLVATSAVAADDDHGRARGAVVQAHRPRTDR